MPVFQWGKIQAACVCGGAACTRNEPTPVPEAEIAAIRMLIQSGLPAWGWPFLRKGQRVEVRYGSLTGVEGILLRTKNDLRLVLSVNLLQRSVAVEIDRDWIRPL